MLCEKCGADNDSNHNYCRVCGEPLMEDIVSDSHYEQTQGERPAKTKRYRGYSLDATKRYHKKSEARVRRRHPLTDDEVTESMVDISQEEARAPQPRTTMHRSYAAPRRAVAYDHQAIDDYDDHFENNKYEKTQREPSYPRQKRRPRSVLSIPYIVVTYFTALVSLLNFVMPFLDWVHFRFSVPMLNVNIDEKLNPFMIIQKLFTIDDVNTLLKGAVQDYSNWDVFPDFIGTKTEALNSALFFAKIASALIFSVFAIGLLLYVVFFVLALFQRKSATGFGIAGAVCMLLSGGGFVLGMTYIAKQTEGLVSILNAPFQLIALSVVLIVLMAVMAILRALSHRR